MILLSKYIKWEGFFIKRIIRKLGICAVVAAVVGTMLSSFPEKQIITASADGTVVIGDNISEDSSEDTTDEGYVLSSEVSNSWRLKNDPEYRNYLEGRSTISASSRAFGVTTPTVPSKMSSYKKYNIVDVSEFQAWHDPIDWEALKKQGITGAIIRAGYRGYGTSGTIVKDQYFDQNVQGALAAGLNVGVYFYTQAISVAEARTEADYVAKWIGSYYITLPVFFDIEYVDYDVGRLDAANLSKTQKTALCTAFCDRMQSYKLYAGVYASKYYFYDELNYTELQSKYEIWLAHYSTTTDYTGSFDVWQYSSNGVVTGIYGYVDLDLWFATTPTKISSVNVVKSGTTLTLSWNRPKGAYAFYIEKYDTATKTYKQLATIKSCTYTLKNVSSTDKYRVVPYKRMGTEVFKSTAYEIPGTGSLTPASPVVSTKVVTKNSVEVRFNQANVTGYRLYIADNSSYTGSTYVQGSSNILKFSSLAADKNYYFKAYTYNISNGQVYWSTPITFTVSTKTVAAVGISKKSAAADSVTVNFTKKSVTGYRLYVADNSSYTGSTYVQGTSTTQTVSGLKPSTTYYFKAYNYIVDNNTAYFSDPVTFTYSTTSTLSTVTGFKATTASKSSVNLTWTKVSGAQGYIVYKYDASKKNYVRITKTTTNGSSYTVSGLSEGTSYLFAIKAYKTVNGSEIVSQSFPTATAVTMLSTVTGFKAATASKSSVNLTWTKVSGAQGYILYKYDASKKNYVRITKTTTNGSSYTVSGLSEGTSYLFAIKAYKTVNGSEIVSQSFPTATAVTTLSTVTGFKAMTASKSSVNLTWTKVSGAQGYILYKYDASKKNYVRITKTTTNGNSYTVSGLSEGTSYLFAIKAYKTVNGSEIVSQSFPTATAVTMLSTVSNTKVTPAKTSLKLTWDKVTGAQGYIVYKYDATKKNYVRVVKTTNTTSAYTITGLQANTSHTVTVKAYKTVNGNEIVSESFIPISAKTTN